MNISKSLDYLHCLSFGTLGNETNVYEQGAALYGDSAAPHCHQ